MAYRAPSPTASSATAPSATEMTGSDHRVQVSPGKFILPQSKKFAISTNGDVVASYSGSQYAPTLARAIVTNCSISQESGLTWENAIMQTVRHVPFQSNERSEVIVIRKDQPGSAIRIKREKPEPEISVVTDWACVGNSSIPVRFLPWQFYTRTRVDQLKRLALLTLTYAETEDPSWIGLGFDVMVLRGDGSIEWEM